MAAVEANNQKLFEKMAKELSEGAYEVYANCTYKLATWLQNVQAYYPAARAQIVRLLLLAQARVRAEVGCKQDLDVPFSVLHHTGHPFVGEYVRLVESIKPFQSFFEGEAQSIKDCIRALVATISGPTASDTSKMTSRPAAMDEQPKSPVSTAGTVKEYNHVSGNEGIIAGPSILASCVPGEGDNMEQQAYTPSSTIPQPHSTISDETECTRQSLSAIDQVSMDDTHFSPIEAKEIQQPSPTRDIQETSAVQASAVLRQVRKAKVKRKALEFDVLAKYDEQELLRKKALTAQTQAKPSDSVAQAMEVSVTTSASDSGPEHERLGKRLQALEQENEAIPNSVGTPTKEIVTDEKQPEKSEMEGHKMEVDTDIIHADFVNKSEKGTPELLDKQGAVASLEDVHISDGNLSNETELTRGDEASSVDMDDGQTESPRFFKQTDRGKISAPLSHVLTTIQLQEIGPPAEGIFGPEMRVIARQLGLENSFRISIGFEIPEAQFSLVTKWSLRKQIEQSHEKSICITLGCYLVADLQRQSEKEELNTFEKQVSSAQPKWPQLPGSLSLTVVNAEENIPLSPPFHVTPDNLVDISSLLALGKNTLKLRQRQDFRQCMFILHAHHPTRRQLQQLQDHWLKKKEWSRFLDEFSAPLPYESLAGLKGMKLCA